MAQTATNYSGSSTGFQLYLDVDVISQDQYNNRSYVHIYSRMYRGAGAYRTYNLTGTPGYITYDGNTQNFSGINFDFNYGQYTFQTLMDTYQYIYHNSDGTKTAYFSTDHNPQISPYLNETAVGFNVTLPTIARNATLTTNTVTNVTDEGFTINVGTDVTCDFWEYSLDNGSTYTTAFSGDFTSKTTTITNKPSNTTYQVINRVRRKDSGLKTTGSAIPTTTLTQNNFIMMLS
jgi:hypothetical protein